MDFRKRKCHSVGGGVPPASSAAPPGAYAKPDLRFPRFGSREQAAAGGSRSPGAWESHSKIYIQLFIPTCFKQIFPEILGVWSAWCQKFLLGPPVPAPALQQPLVYRNLQRPAASLSWSHRVLLFPAPWRTPPPYPTPPHPNYVQQLPGNLRLHYRDFRALG